MSWNCRFIPETPEAHRDSIHHICISICTLTSHTHSTLNKLHSEWKHAACWSLMCLHCVHTPTSHIHHVELAVCLVFLFFFPSNNHAQSSSTQFYALLHCPITTHSLLLSHRCRFLDLQLFVAASGAAIQDCETCMKGFASPDWWIKPKQAKRFKNPSMLSRNSEAVVPHILHHSFSLLLSFTLLGYLSYLHLGPLCVWYVYRKSIPSTHCQH